MPYWSGWPLQWSDCGVPGSPESPQQAGASSSRYCCQSPSPQRPWLLFAPPKFCNHKPICQRRPTHHKQLEDCLCSYVVAVDAVLLVLAQRRDGGERLAHRGRLEPDRAALGERGPHGVALDGALVRRAARAAARGAALVVDLLALGRQLGGAGRGGARARDGREVVALVDGGRPGGVGRAVVGDVDVGQGTGARDGRRAADEVEGLAPVAGAAGGLALGDGALDVLVATITSNLSG